ncbi:MAG: hypothetical protein Fur0023_14040 [Bacteroidia bacterium]
MYAQLNFYEGYIVSDSGDTLRGEIKANPKKELSLFAKVMFRDKQGFTKTYKPDKINGFGYLNSEKKKWHHFISIKDDEAKFYKLAVLQPLIIYEYQFEDMQMGEFFTAKQYFIKENNKFVRLKSKKLKKQLETYIDNTEVLGVLENMDEIDIDKLSSLLEKHYSKSSS